MTNHECDVVVIGSGPGGYVAAIRASQLGLKTICVEKENLGGICLNWGCIPTKALLRSAEQMEFLKMGKDFGFKLGRFGFDMPKIVKRSRDVAGRMSNGIGFLFKKYKVKQVKGTGFIKEKGLVEVSDGSGKKTDRIKAKHIIVATGARPRMIPGIEVDRETIITSKEAMIQEKVPKKMVVMGAGAIGVEFAYFFNAFGAEVTIVEMMDRILPLEDPDISKELARHFRKTGLKLVTSAKVKSAKTVKNKAEIAIEKKDGSEETLTADLALNAIGVQGNFENLGLEDLGVETDRGYIKIDKQMRTNVEGIYAIGDIAGPPWLAHKASAEGIACVEFIAGEKDAGVDYDNIPACTYCRPQVASVGLTEDKAKEKGYEVKVGKFPFTASGKAHAIGDAQGFVKLVIDAKYGEILGAHMVGPEVTELLAEINSAKALDATGKALAKVMHAHPTLSEAIMEAAAIAYGEAVNF